MDKYGHMSIHPQSEEGIQLPQPKWTGLPEAGVVKSEIWGLN